MGVVWAGKTDMPNRTSAASPMNDAQSRPPGDIAAGSIEELGRMGFALAMQMLRHHEDAADAVQDAMQRMIRKRALFDSRRGSQRAWFLKIVRNRCLDLLRIRKRQQCVALEPAKLESPAQQPPDVTVQQREQFALLRETLLDMPEPQREIILLRDFHQLSYAEIADVLSLPSGTVMSRLHRARLELRQRLAGRIPSDPDPHSGGQR
jgi:RNA polymerase sigma-70 factor (ECF subfamily)